MQEAAEELAPRLEIILQHLLCAFGKYQVSSRSYGLDLDLYFLCNGVMHVMNRSQLEEVLCYFVPFHYNILYPEAEPSNSL